MFNMVQAYAAADRIPSLHLDDRTPVPQLILDIPLDKYLPSDLDEIDLRAEMTTLITRTLCTYIPVFQELSSDIKWHIHR